MRQFDMELVDRLNDQVWIRPVDGSTLEVAVVPAAANCIEMFGSMIEPEIEVRRVCSRAFVDFRGAQRDGADVPNTFETRCQLYRLTQVRDAVRNELLMRSRQVLEGEGSSGSA